MQLSNAHIFSIITLTSDERGPPRPDRPLIMAIPTTLIDFFSQGTFHASDIRALVEPGVETPAADRHTIDGSESMITRVEGVED